MRRLYMKKRVSIFLISILLLSTIFAPPVSAIMAQMQIADTGGSGEYWDEDKVKDALYAIAAYDCIWANQLQDTALGNKYESIIQDLRATTYIGPWVGDADGKISCSEAFKNTFGSGNITESALRSRQIFEGVYDQGVGNEHRVKCNYAIVNSEGTGKLEGGPFSWPAGYYNGPEGLVDWRRHGAIEIVFDENGPLRLEGAINDIDANFTLEAIKPSQMRIDWQNWKDSMDICDKITQFAPGYQYPDVNALGEQITNYSTLRTTTDKDPFRNWGPEDWWYQTPNKAWISSNSQDYKQIVTDEDNSVKLILTDNAKNQLLENFARKYLGVDDSTTINYGSMDGSSMLNWYLGNHPDAKYILYGRYLFNGDGNGPTFCNGVSISVTDADYDDLLYTIGVDYWDSSHDYVAVTKAYTATSLYDKLEFRTKFGGNGIYDPGYAASITARNSGVPYPGNCKNNIAPEFNGIEPTTTNAKRIVAGYMNVTTISALPDNNTNTGGGATGGNNNESTDPTCLNSTSLGWIICPVLSLAASAVTGIYNYIIGPQFLEVSSSYIENGSAASKVWATFRNFANIIFVIVIAIVIFSQLTGVGITNYGIKKMLPRLIMMAVIVNISFFICQLAVDISNIVGYGIQNLLESQANSVLTGEVTTISGFASHLLGNFLGTAGSAVALVGVGWLASVTWEFWIWPLVFFMIGAVISILFFAIILVVRQAGVIILAVISPVAIVCYALPNTKKFFDRWLKMFTSLLIVFPICGALMGGGLLVSKILLSTNNDSGNGSFMFGLVAMLLQVVPFFFIPTIVKSSFSAMGQLGNQISMMGKRLSGATTGAIRHSEMYKDSQDQLRAENAERRLRNQNPNSLLARLARGNGRIANFARNANNRTQSRLIQTAVGGAVANRNAERVAGVGLDAKMDRALSAAASRELDESTKEFEADYRNDVDFMGSLDAQRNAYINAIRDLDENENDQAALARVRALQNVLGTGEAGRNIMQNALLQRMYETGTIGNGLRRAGNSLLADHQGYKGDSRAFHALASGIANGNALTDGRITRHVDQNQREYFNHSIYNNAAANGTAAELGAIDTAAINRIAENISAGNMSAADMEAFDRKATEAITNNTIGMKKDNEDALNAARRAIYDQQLKAYEAANQNILFDDFGKAYKRLANGTYEAQEGGAIFGFDAANKQLIDLSNGSAVSDTRDARAQFIADHGPYQDIHRVADLRVNHNP